VNRAGILADVMRAVDELDDPTVYGPSGECRYHEVVHMLSAVDWGAVPIDVIRAVFSTIARKTPLDVLDRAPHERSLVEQARYAVEYNAKMRIEMAADDADDEVAA
jgi:hypothetical protein